MGKVIINWNYFKSMLAKIHKDYKIIKHYKKYEYIHFVHSQHQTQDKCILRGVLWQNSNPPPHGSGYNTSIYIRSIYVWSSYISSILHLVNLTFGKLLHLGNLHFVNFTFRLLIKFVNCDNGIKFGQLSYLKAWLNPIPAWVSP